MQIKGANQCRSVRPCVDRKLEEHPEDLRTLRNLVAKALGLPAEPPRMTLWERAVRRWRPLQYTQWVVLALGLSFSPGCLGRSSTAKQKTRSATAHRELLGRQVGKCDPGECA
jgi:hypothetical protein